MAQASTLKRPRLPLHQAPGPADSAQEAQPSATPVPFAMLSHRGRVRHANQDACGALPQRGVFLICDGMGGAAAGEVASQLAVNAFLHTIVQPMRTTARGIWARAASGNGVRPSSSNGVDSHPDSDSRTCLEEAVRAANQAVFRHSQKSPRLLGMGTTLVALLCEDAAPPGTDVRRRAESRPATRTLWLAHVGDSRCYRFRSGALHLLTQDHSLVEEQVQAGLLSRVQAGTSPIRNIITRAIGSQPTVEPEISSQRMHSGDLYLLASDGLTRELPEDDIADILRQTAGPSTLQAACQALIDAANHSGGHDNITVLLVACP